jgi:hypothetical protein
MPSGGSRLDMSGRLTFLILKQAEPAAPLAVIPKSGYALSLASARSDLRPARLPAPPGGWHRPRPGGGAASLPDVPRRSASPSSLGRAGHVATAAPSLPVVRFPTARRPVRGVSGAGGDLPRAGMAPSDSRCRDHHHGSMVDRARACLTSELGTRPARPTSPRYARRTQTRLTRRSGKAASRLPGLGTPTRPLPRRPAGPGPRAAGSRPRPLTGCVGRPRHSPR